MTLRLSKSENGRIAPCIGVTGKPAQLPVRRYPTRSIICLFLFLLVMGRDAHADEPLFGDLASLPLLSISLSPGDLQPAMESVSLVFIATSAPAERFLLKIERTGKARAAQTTVTAVQMQEFYVQATKIIRNFRAKLESPKDIPAGKLISFNVFTAPHNVSLYFPPSALRTNPALREFLASLNKLLPNDVQLP